MKKVNVFVLVAIGILIISSVTVIATESWKIIVSNQKFTVDGQSVNANPLNINGYNYVKVAEFAELLDIDVSYNSSTDIIAFDKSKHFSGVRIIEDEKIKEGAINVEKITVYLKRSFEPSAFVFHITPDKKLIRQEVERDYNYFDSPERTPISTEEETLSQDEYAKLVNSLSDNSFMTLPKELNNFDISDGATMFVEVQADGINYRVGGYMPQSSNERFSIIYNQITDIIYRKPKDLDTTLNNGVIKFEINPIIEIRPTE